jgi:phosphoribosylformimino-5-aminoimidazole carboxamide ribotide isomerase
MIILPAIDLYKGYAVRLVKGDYNKMTVYDKNPENVAKAFEKAGAKHLHIVDLEGAKSGGTPNFPVIKKIADKTSLFCEVGGGIRSEETIKAYLSAGVGRVILGTAAVTDEGFLRKALSEFGDKIAVGADIKDGFVAIKGWTEKAPYTLYEFCDKMQKAGVSTLICTDISRDGVMKGTNLQLYSDLSSRYKMKIIASGGVSSLEDVKRLAEMNMYGAIIGRAYYEGSLDIAEAVKIVEVDNDYKKNNPLP